jgi:hypothetical protein
MSRWARPVRRVVAAPGGGHGHRARTLSTVLSAATIAMPRARIEGEDGNRHDWPS